MSCSITDVEFLLEVISDLVRKTCCPLRYLQSPAFLKNLMCGHAEVFCETEWRKFVFQLGWKILWRYLLKLFLITLSPRGSETSWKECFSAAMCFSSLPIVMYCLTHPGSGQLNRPQSLSSFPDSSGDLTGFTGPGSSAAKQVFSFLIDSLFPCYPLSYPYL